VRQYSKFKNLIRLYRILSIGISALFHPLLLLTYIFILAGYYAPLAIAPLNTVDGRIFLIELIFSSTFLLPFLLLTLYILIQNRQWSIKKFFMDNARERVFPLFIIGCFYSILIYFIKITPQLNDVVLVTMTCTTSAILLVALISSFWKISAHAVGISGMIGILADLNNKIPNAALFYPITILILFAGCLFSARLYLNAHTPAQLCGGTILGLVISGFGYFFL
jgi:hypothetical protein